MSTFTNSATAANFNRGTVMCFKGRTRDFPRNVCNMHNLLGLNLFEVTHWAIASLTGIWKWGSCGNFCVPKFPGFMQRGTLKCLRCCRLSVRAKNPSGSKIELTTESVPLRVCGFRLSWMLNWKWSVFTHHCSLSVILMGGLSLSRSKVLTYFALCSGGMEAKTLWLLLTHAWPETLFCCSMQWGQLDSFSFIRDWLYTVINIKIMNCFSY